MSRTKPVLVIGDLNADLILTGLSGHPRYGREVLVSRGELVEIGGAFRVPDVIQQGGATLREVGTTNRTRTRDYASAITKKTAAILRDVTIRFEENRKLKRKLADALGAK